MLQKVFKSFSDGIQQRAKRAQINSCCLCRGSSQRTQFWDGGGFVHWLVSLTEAG